MGLSGLCSIGMCLTDLIISMDLGLIHMPISKQNGFFRSEVSKSNKAHIIILYSKSLFRDFDPQLPPNGGCEGEKNITK